MEYLVAQCDELGVPAADVSAGKALLGHADGEPVMLTRCSAGIVAVLAVALAFASSLCWGLADFLGGLQSRTRPLVTVLLVAQVAAVAVGAAVGGVLRWACGLALNALHSHLVLGTLAVNCAGGLLVGLAAVCDVLVAAEAGTESVAHRKQLGFSDEEIGTGRDERLADAADRPVLPTVLAAMSAATRRWTVGQLPSTDPYLRPGEIRHKRFGEAILQLAEEGLLQVFMPQSGFRHPIVGVVGALQFDVIAARRRGT